MASALGGLTGGLPGLGGGGGPLDSVGGLAGGVTGGGGGGPLDSVGGLAGGLTGDAGGGLGDTLGGVTGLAGGLLGGGEGLNLVGLVGVGSDDKALLDLNPAEKKEVKAQKAAVAAKNEQKRQAAAKKLREQIQAQGGKATPEQQKLAQQLQESEAADRRDMARLDQILGPTDPDLFQAAMANDGATNAPEGPSPSLQYAYLVDSQTHMPTHMLTFANAAAADQWHRQATAMARVEKVSPQMYMYEGVAPRPAGKMACMPIQTVQPVIPLQRADGYPICCKPSGSRSNAAPASTTSTTLGGSSSGTQAPLPPPRQKLTFHDAAKAQVENAKNKGDSRPVDEIYQEALKDLQDQCCSNKSGNEASGQSAVGSGGLPNASNSGLANGTMTNAVGPNGGSGSLRDLGGTSSSLPGASGGGVGGDLLGGLGGGLLGSGQGLNVAGLLAIGSDEKALLDLNPAQKKEEKLKRAKELQKQQNIQQQQMQALQEQVKRQNGQATAEQQKAHKELLERQQATRQAGAMLSESMKRDAADEQQQKGLGGGLPAGLPGGLPGGGTLGGLTNGLPTDAVGGLANGLPTSGITNGLPTSGLTKGLGL